MSVTMQISKFIFIIIALAVISCERFVSEEELRKYILDPKNSLIKEIVQGTVKISLKFHPADLLIARELKSEDEISEKKIEEIRKNYEDYCYFILTMAENGEEILTKTISDQNKFIDGINMLSFNLNQEIRMLTSEKDTIPLADFVYPRMYGSTGNTQLMIVFPMEKIYKSEWVDIELGDLGLGLGINKFHFDISDLLNVPKVSFNKKN